MPFVGIIHVRHPDGESIVRQSRCNSPPYSHLRHTTQPDLESYLEQEEVDCQKHPSVRNLPLLVGEVLEKLWEEEPELLARVEESTKEEEPVPKEVV